MSSRLDVRRTLDVARELEAALDYSFAKPKLLGEALTHASSSGLNRRRRRATPTNERLEFLGDRVLGLVVAQMLIEHYPDATEGALTKRSQVLVSKETLAAVAADINLERFLRTAGANENGVREPTAKMRADACEALIGALYLDGGLDAAGAFVVRHWTPRVEAMVEPPSDPKMALQEWALVRGLPLPAYVVLERSGPAHAPRFVVETAVEGHAPEQAEAGSKRAAEQAAARLLLARLEGGRDD